MTSPPVISVAGLRKAFGSRTALDGIDFEVAGGVCTGLIGPNGAGKTTVIRVLLGLSPPDAGQVRVLGFELPAQAGQARARLGVVPQTDSLDPDFKVAENLRVYGGYYGLAKSELERRIPRLLDFVNLGERAHENVGELSGGMQRRLTIARALINDPDLLILDEPTTGLDPQVRHLIWARLRSLKSRGKTLFLTTHYMEEAERLCDEVLIMDAGRIIARGGPHALIHLHVEPAVIEISAAPPAVREALQQAGGIRVESVGESLYCYTDDSAGLARRLDGWGLGYLTRPPSLEDVFLHLTGHGVRE